MIGSHSRWPAWAREFRSEMLSYLADMKESIMTDQEKLDADVKALQGGLGNVEAEIANLKNHPQAAALDFSALDAAVARLQADGTPTP